MTSRIRQELIIWSVVLAVALGALPAQAADRSLEYAVKATFLYKFASFVDWPAGSFEHDTSPFYLCVAGPDPFGGRIADAVAGQNVGRHPIVLRSLETAEARSNCHSLLVSGSSQQVAEVLSAVRGTPTLTITDSSVGRSAGIIHFVIVDDRVSFDIDNVAAAANRLVVSSKLLALARKVRTERPGTLP